MAKATRRLFSDGLLWSPYAKGMDWCSSMHAMVGENQMLKCICFTSVMGLKRPSESAKWKHTRIAASNSPLWHLQRISNIVQKTCAWMQAWMITWPSHWTKVSWWRRWDGSVAMVTSKEISPHHHEFPPNNKINTNVCYNTCYIPSLHNKDCDY